jgi:uncharacterized membrane protein
MHGGATHFPIALLIVSVLFDHAGFWWQNNPRRRDFVIVGFFSIMIAAVASFGAVLSGLALSHGKLLGTGAMSMHHWFVWPAFSALVGLAVWRLVVRDRASRRALASYLVLATATALAMIIGGFWGGEMVLGR